MDLEIKASIKKQAGELYPFVVNIDGQAVRLIAPGVKEKLPFAAGPEAGGGVRFSIDRTLRLSAGLHAIFFAAPVENWSTQFEANLREGSPNLLEFKPRYRWGPGRDRMPGFINGVYGFDAVMNGRRQ